MFVGAWMIAHARPAILGEEVVCGLVSQAAEQSCADTEQNIEKLLRYLGV